MSTRMAVSGRGVSPARKSLPRRIAGVFRKDWQLMLLALPSVAFILIFAYIPMYGAQIAFRKYNVVLGIWGSQWVGFDNFVKFFQSYQFVRVVRNTIFLSFYGLLAGFPVPILLALALNACRQHRFRRTVQMVTYAPYFISTVVMVGMLMQVLSPKFGIINAFLRALGGSEIMFMGTARYFSHIYVWSGVWQFMGYSAVIYISALSGVDPTQHEAAIVDGASRFKRILHIDLPHIVPTIVILLILNAGSIMNVGFEKVFLLQNDMNLEYSEVISTYIYKVGLAAAMPDFSYSTAIGFFNSIVNLILLGVVNFVSRRLSGTGLF